MDIDWCIAEVTKGNCLPERIFKSLCDICMEILAEESNVQPVETPVNICGDIHGQFYDVLKLFTVGGSLPETSYIFIGDYVDRGYHSIETMQLLLCYKAKYPGRITLLRGNHESRAITQFYGFFEECQKKYGNNNVWKHCTDLFDYLPLGALVDGKVLCIHGGLSPDIKSIDQIRLIDRINEIPHEGPFSDLMWSDPEEIDTWAINSRGAGWLFGAKVTKEFVHLNGLELIARAHQLVMEGYKFWFPEKQLVTVWSAPNYCYRCGNVASILKLNENLNREFKIFESTPDPNQSQTAPKQTLLPYFL